MLAACFVSLLMTNTDAVAVAVVGAESSQLPSIFQTPLVSVLSGCLQIHLRNVHFCALGVYHFYLSLRFALGILCIRQRATSHSL